MLTLVVSSRVCVHGLTAVGYPACAAACFAYANQMCLAAVATGPAAPATFSACVATAAAACAAGCLCFDVNTTVDTRTGTRKMCELSLEEEVRTAHLDATIWTKVKAIHTVEGDFDFVTLETSSWALKVTPEHPVFVHEGGQIVVREAGTIAVGDVLVGDGCLEVVDRVIQSNGSAKIIVETEHGTVLANGVLARGMMPEEYVDGASLLARNVADLDAGVLSELARRCHGDASGEPQFRCTAATSGAKVKMAAAQNEHGARICGDGSDFDYQKQTEVVPKVGVTN